MPKVFATADIGSNTAHLLIAEANASSFRRIENISEWLALGEIVAQEGEIPKNVLNVLIKSLKQFRTKAIEHGAGSFYSFATEAIRVAKNRDEVLGLIKSEVGIDVKTISAKEEAAFGLKGSSLDVKISGSYLYLELGGGSLQVAFCNGPQILQEFSIPLGTGKLKNYCTLSSIPTSEELQSVNNKIINELDFLPKFKAKTAVASGGVARGIARSLHPEGEKTIHQFEVAFLCKAFEVFDIESLAMRFPVGQKRTSSMAYGLPVFNALMQKFKLNTMTVSSFGVREGAILKLFSGELQGTKLRK